MEAYPPYPPYPPLSRMFIDSILSSRYSVDIINGLQIMTGLSFL